jgi:hypothetical protein
METNADGTYFQEGDHLRLKRTQETGIAHGTGGEVVYVLMDATNETRLFSASVDEDAYIELIVFANGSRLSRNGEPNRGRVQQLPQEE